GRGLAHSSPGSLQNVSIKNVVARNCLMTSSVTGLPGAPVRRVVLDGLTLGMRGGDRELKGLDVPEHAAKYPEGNMFGQLPAFGLYVRHVEGLALSNSHSRGKSEDLRPNMILDDVKDVPIDGSHTDPAPPPPPVLWSQNVIDGFVRGSRIPAAPVF